jgi:hypothetical protein
MLRNAVAATVLGAVVAIGARPARAASEPNPIRPADQPAPGPSAAPAVPDPVPTAEQAAEIAKLIGQLSEAKFEAREAAYKKLLDIGRPALSALRKVETSKDAEVASSAKRLVTEIEKTIRARVRVKVLRPTEPGEREVILESEEATVTVRETRKEFTVAVQKPGGATELTTAPTSDEFRKKHPELWKRWAEPALDASDPDKLAVEAMVRQLMPQIVATFTKENGREPTAAEKADAEKLLREETRKALEANRAKAKDKDKEGTPPKP